MPPDPDLAPRKSLVTLLKLGALILCAAVAGCAGKEAEHPFHSMPLRADGSDFAAFEGRWYDEDANLMVVVQSDPERTFSIRLSEVFEVSEARGLEGELAFEVRGNLGGGTVCLRQQAQDVVVLLLCGTEPTPGSPVFYRDPSLR